MALSCFDMTYFGDDNSSFTPRRDSACVVPMGRAAGWTGRSVVSSETDTVLSHISTSGLHRTRVSEMRDRGPQASRIFIGAETPRDFAHSYAGGTGQPD